MEGSDRADHFIANAGLKKDLDRNKNNFRQLFNCIPFPQWIFDISTLQILAVNISAIEQYGYSEDEFLHKSVLDLAPRDEIQKLKLYCEFMKTTRQVFSAVYFHQTKGGKNLLVESRFYNMRFGSQPCVLLNSSDITQKISFDEKITLSKIARQQKIGRASISDQEKERGHIGKELQENINQLLAASKIYLELAHANDEVRIDFIDKAEKIIVKAIQETRSLSNSLVPAGYGMFGLEESLNDLISIFKVPGSFEVNLSIDKALNDTDPEIQICLFRIVQEQLGNISKHASAQKVMITLNMTDQIHLSIVDDGKGCDVATVTVGSGISNIRSRVDLYNGNMKILSEAGNGYALMINIPVQDKDKSEAQATVIIVEDDEDDQEIVIRAFAEIAPHYTITCLSNGKLLVDLLHSLPESSLPSLIILDYNMPLLNGLETLQLLEIDQRYNKIPKIIYSSSSQHYIKNLCYAAHAKAYITKGVTMDEIKENIREMLTLV
ncbi:MAG TPA: response regulator [Puia sp.]|nr:response regulator [Puia sp.]